MRMLHIYALVAFVLLCPCISQGQWKPITAIRSASLLWFVDADSGYTVASTFDDSVYQYRYTTDGGQSWSVVTPLGFAPHLSALSVENFRTFYIGNDDVWRTRDGGRTWDSLKIDRNLIHERSAFFVRDSLHYFIGANILALAKQRIEELLGGASILRILRAAKLRITLSITLLLFLRNGDWLPGVIDAIVLSSAQLMEEQIG